MKRNKERDGRRQPVFGCVKKILRLFLRKPKKIINAAGELEPGSIIVCNHSAKMGPVYLELYFPLYHYVWGAGEMLGNYSDRFHYLRDVFYMQKRGFKKFPATVAATFEAVFSPLIYKGMKVLPTYANGRLHSTINKSIDMLSGGTSILIFPEDSSHGYLDEMSLFFPGFVLLAQMYRKKTGRDVPVYPVYYHIKKRILCIGAPVYVGEYTDAGYTREQIAELLRQKVNKLYNDYCKD